MLDFMRKGASSLFIKILLGAIVLTFVGFFALSDYAPKLNQPQGATAPIAKVNSENIPYGLYVMELRQQLSRYPSELQSQIRPMLENQILNRMITDKLLAQAANQAGIFVSDEALSEKIVDELDVSGKFDQELYNKEIRPNFQKRTGVDPEAWMREQLAKERIAESLSNAAILSQKTLKDRWLVRNAEVKIKQFEANIDDKILPQKEAEKITNEWILLNKNLESSSELLSREKISEKIKESDIGPSSIEAMQRTLGGFKSKNLVNCLVELKVGDTCQKWDKLGNKLITFQLLERTAPTLKEEELNLLKDQSIQANKLLIQQKTSDLLLKRAKVQTFNKGS